MSSNFISIIKKQQFQDWKGIDPEYTLEKIKNDFNVIHETESTLGIPAQKTDLFFLEEQDYEVPIEFHCLRQELVRIFIENPKVANVHQWLKTLGAPSIKQDYYVDVIKIKNGEWIFLDKGLALMLNEEEDHLFGLSLFSPCNEADFQKNINVLREEPIEFELDDN